MVFLWKCPRSTEFIFFFNDTATPEIYTLSLHDALPIYPPPRLCVFSTTTSLVTGKWTLIGRMAFSTISVVNTPRWPCRSEEHTSELQSRQYLVCRLLLEKQQHLVSRLLPSNTQHPLEFY